VNTTDILFICGGAFIGLEKVIQRRLGRHTMGFGAIGEAQKHAGAARDEMLQHAEPEDLLNFGFIPEFIGRLPILTTLAELTEEQLVFYSHRAEERADQAIRQAHGDGRRGTGIHARRAARTGGPGAQKGTGARALRD